MLIAMRTATLRLAGAFPAGELSTVSATDVLGAMGLLFEALAGLGLTRAG
jgi:hypothetical protein